ncbi:type III restriction endonuclease subunit R, partial [Klebsiella pneumoniae]
MTFNEFWEEADVTVIDDAYRRAARIFSPDVSRTYVEYLAGKVADREEDAEEYLEAIMEARVTVAGMGLVMEVQDYFDGEADRLAKAWLAEYTPQIKS